MSNVVVLAPHPDDESIGCGGMLRRHSLDGDRVVAVFLTSGERGVDSVVPPAAAARREAEAEKAAAVLGLADLHFLRLPDYELTASADAATAPLSVVLANEQPSWIYLPHPADAHPDHLAVAPILGAALPPGMSAVIRGYEVWGLMPAPHAVHDITDVMEDKLSAIRCYETQLKHLRYDRAVAGLNSYRGELFAGAAYAEAYAYLEVEELRSRSAAGRS